MRMAFAALCVLLAGVLGCGGGSTSRVAAQPVELSPQAKAQMATLVPSQNANATKFARPGLGNLACVSNNLYRGAKPSGEGFGQLKAMGVRTVVDLGYYFFEVDNLRDRQLSYEHIPFYTYNPQDAQVVRFLRLATDPARGPVFVHCRKGADRTGFMVAIYRVVVSGWSKERAIDEMVRGGFGFDPTYQNLINYIRTKDLDALARQAGINTPSVVATVR